LILETGSSQLDFNKLYLINISDMTNLEWKVEQSREVVPRAMFGDRIKECRIVFNKNCNYSVALRQSGHVDLYWNMQLQDESSVKVKQIEMSFDEMYFRLENGDFCVVDTKHGNEVRMEVATEISYPNFRFDRVIWQNIKSYANIFESTALIKTTLWVSHNRFMSVFNLISQTWEHHIQFANRIELIRKREDEENFTLAALERQQGRLFLNVMEVVEENHDQKYFSFRDTEPDRVFEGDIL